MSENQTKVNSIEELISKAKEFTTSHREVKIGNSAVNSGEYTLTKNGLVPKTKGFVEIELRGESDASIELVLEEAEFQEKPERNQEFYNKVIQELNKEGIYHSHRKPEEPETPKKDENKNSNDKPKKHEPSETNIHCQNIQQVKNSIKEYYQKNQTEINKNPDFSQ